MFRLLTQRKTYSPIGLDIGRCGVRAAQVLWRGPRKREYAGVCTASCEWPAGSRVRSQDGGLSHLLQQEPDRRELAERIRRLLRLNEFRGRAAVVGLSSPEVELHALELPPAQCGVSSKSLREAAHWELERLMSFEKGAVETDYWSLPASKSAPITALGVAARKCDVEAVTRLCLDAGLDCHRVDAGVCGLARFAASVRPAAAPGSSSDLWGVLDLGHRQSRLALCIEATPVVVRTFDTGCAKWITMLAEVLELTPAAAEIHLRDHGIQPFGRGLRADDPAAPSAQLGGIIRNILRPELDALCDEIERTYRYALQCYPDRQSSELILAGGGSEVKNLGQHLHEKLGIQVSTPSQHWAILDPAADRSAGTRHALGTLSCAVGLALPTGES